MKVNRDDMAAAEDRWLEEIGKPAMALAAARHSRKQRRAPAHGGFPGDVERGDDGREHSGNGIAFRISGTSDYHGKCVCGWTTGGVASREKAQARLDEHVAEHPAGVARHAARMRRVHLEALTAKLDAANEEVAQEWESYREYGGGIARIWDALDGFHRSVADARNEIGMVLAGSQPE